MNTTALQSALRIHLHYRNYGPARLEARRLCHLLVAQLHGASQ